MSFVIEFLVYFGYLCLHKWYVLLAGIKIAAPLFRLIIHDMHRFRPSSMIGFVTYSEFMPYVPEWTDSMCSEEALKLRHNDQYKGKYNWQHWVLIKNDGTLYPVEMPDKYVYELVADWMAHERFVAKGKDRWNPSEYYLQNRDKMIIHPNTHRLILTIMRAHDFITVEKI